MYEMQIKFRLTVATTRNTWPPCLLDISPEFCLFIAAVSPDHLIYLTPDCG